MAEFGPAYSILIRNEGGYLNDSDDWGGETFMGISRRFHPNWQGWTIIDFYRSNGGTIRNGEYLPAKEQSWIMPLVFDWYKQQWSRSQAGKINSQEVANIYFDFWILAAEPVALMQSTLNQLGHNLVVDNIIGPKTLAAINNTDPNLLHDTYKQMRLGYHKERVQSGAVHAKFLPGWEKRTNKFASLTSSFNHSDFTKKGVYALLGAGTLLYLYSQLRLKE